MADRDAAHVPVLCAEVLAGLCVQPQGTYVDSTFGRGGHAARIVAALDRHGRLVVMDRDAEAVASAAQQWRGDARVSVVHSAFSRFDEVLAELGIESVDGVLFDLGVSSPQLDAASRGFSFGASGPLDMRMDRDSGAPVADWLNSASEKELASVLLRYGEERHARRIARAIVARRAQSPWRETGELAELCENVSPRRQPGHKHPATRTFQALRIFVNDELGELERALPQAAARLKHGGRLVVISFHSLEDRIVKRFIRGPLAERRRARMPATGSPWPLRAVGKAQRPGAEELRRNPRARSAVLRVAEKCS